MFAFTRNTMVERSKSQKLLRLSIISSARFDSVRIGVKSGGNRIFWFSWNSTGSSRRTWPLAISRFVEAELHIKLKSNFFWIRRRLWKLKSGCFRIEFLRPFFILDLTRFRYRNSHIRERIVSNSCEIRIECVNFVFVFIINQRCQ